MAIGVGSLESYGRGKGDLKKLPRNHGEDREDIKRNSF